MCSAMLSNGRGFDAESAASLPVQSAAALVASNAKGPQRMHDERRRYHHMMHVPEGWKRIEKQMRADSPGEEFDDQQLANSLRGPAMM